MDRSVLNKLLYKIFKISFFFQTYPNFSLSFLLKIDTFTLNYIKYNAYKYFLYFDKKNKYYVRGKNGLGGGGGY